MTQPIYNVADSLKTMNEKDKLKQLQQASAKRFISVVEPEKADGNVEYKRQLHNCSAARLEKLKTQMSYRLDEGHGRCIYRIGVEDDGCHSLLDYGACAETAHTLELLARSLNSVVLERKLIQGEIMKTPDGQPLKSKCKIICSIEPSLFGNGKDQLHDGFEHEHEEKTQDGNPTDRHALSKEPGVYTRAELTLQRIETHLLDPSPVSVSSIAKENGKGTAVNCSLEDLKEGRMDVAETLSKRNIRVAVVGNVDAGKSTLIGTLTSSCLDDGRGSSRTSIMKHRHEIESGRTSTASTHLMGFRSSGEAIGTKDAVRANRRKSEDEVVKQSYRVISLMDLAGHEKYLKTTIHGVASGMADYALILVNSRHNPTHMTHHHLNLCVSFGIHVIIVFTKIDGCPDHAFKTSKSEVTKLLKAPDVGKQPFEIKTEADIEKVMGKMNALAPIITTSCVTGQGVDLLQKLLFALPKRRRHEKKIERPFEFLVDDIFNVPGVGAVVSGFVNAGHLSVGSSAHVYVGPVDDGTFIKTVAKTAQIARINTHHVTAGQSACLALALSKDVRKKLRRGMVVLKESPTSTKEFEAEICVLKGVGTTIRKSYQAFVHILNVRQSAFARKIDIVQSVPGIPSSHTAQYGEENEVVLRPGSRAKVRFEFAQRPEYIRPGMRMLFRDGRVRGVGLVTSIPTVDPAK